MRIELTTQMVQASVASLEHASPQRKNNEPYKKHSSTVFIKVKPNFNDGASLGLVFVNAATNSAPTFACLVGN